MSPSAADQVALELTERIQNGTYQPGSLLPTVRDLAAHYDISPSTARHAVNKLVQNGLVYTDGRRGTVVRSQERADFYPTDALRPGRPASGGDAFREQAERMKREPSVRFTMLMRVPPPGILERLGLPPNTIAVERTTIQMLDGEPWSRERSWYDVALARETGLDSPDDIEVGAIRALAKAGHRETAHRDEIIDAAATAEDAHDLRVPLGSPLLVQTRTAATDERVTRVTQTVRLGGRNRLIWETGTRKGIAVIREQLAEEGEVAR